MSQTELLKKCEINGDLHNGTVKTPIKSTEVLRINVGGRSAQLPAEKVSRPP